jgi:hypothetical protein
MDRINCYVKVWFEPGCAAPYFREALFELPNESDLMGTWVSKVTQEYMEKNEDGNVKVEYTRRRPMRRFMKRAEKREYATV